MLSCMQSASLCHNSFFNLISPLQHLCGSADGANANCCSADVLVEKLSVNI